MRKYKFDGSLNFSGFFEDCTEEMRMKMKAFLFFFFFYNFKTGSWYFFAMCPTNSNDLTSQ